MRPQYSGTICKYFIELILVSTVQRTLLTQNGVSSPWLGKQDSIGESNYSKIFERKEEIIRLKVALIKDKDWIN